MRLRFLRSFIFVLFSFSSSLSSLSHAYEKGVTGIAFKVEAEGVFWNPTIKKLTVESIAVGSAAERAGVMNGDEILEIAGVAVQGLKSDQIKAVLNKEVGTVVTIKVRRKQTETLSITLSLQASTN